MSHRESPRKRGQQFLKPEDRTRFYEQMREQSHEFYGGGDMSLGGPDARLTGAIEGLHGTDFLNTVIPAIIQRVQKVSPHEKVKILDIGCGIGLFTDDIRQQFGDAVDVFGTSLDKKKSRYKKRYLSAVYNGPDLVKPTIHPNDAKWRSLMELHDFSEFDLMIDTFGEFYYNEGDAESFLHLLHIAIKKLLPNGRLYIAMLLPEYLDLVRKQQIMIEQKENVVIDWNSNQRGVIITKLENQPT